MNAPNQLPYHRRPRKSEQGRHRKRTPHVIPAGPAPYPDTGAGTQGKQSTQNPYVFNPKLPPTPEPQPKNPFRSVAQRKPIPPARNLIRDQRQIRGNPVDFAISVLGVKPWQKQNQILKAIANHGRVSVRSCNGAGKTFTAAITILWWLMSHDNAIVITTAPSERQVREILWREVRRLYMPIRDLIGGKLTRTRLEFSPSRYAYGFSTNTEDRFQGFHSGNILVIVDEASGVDEFIYNAVFGVITNKNSKLLMIGNPHGYAGSFYDSFHKDRKNFETIHISAFDLPAFKEAGITEDNIKDVEYPTPPTDDENDPDEFDTLPPDNSPLGLTSPEWALEAFNKYGPHSSIYQTRVLGQFPEEADDTLIPLRDVEAAVKRQTDVIPDSTPIMGVDVARFGSDKTVIIVRRGSKVVYIEEIRKSDIVNTTGTVVSAAKRFKVRDIIVDEVGVGAGVLDNLKADRRFKAQGINGGSRPANTEKYLNLRAETFDGLRARFQDGDISIPNDPELISQIASLTYRYNARGQLQLESKDQIRSTGRQSPDKADAIALAFADSIKTRPRPSIKFYTPRTLARLKRAKRYDRRFRD